MADLDFNHMKNYSKFDTVALEFLQILYMGMKKILNLHVLEFFNPEYQWPSNSQKTEST